MNPIFSRYPQVFPKASPLTPRGLLLCAFVIFGAIWINARPPAQNGSDPAAEFKQLSAELSAARLSGGDENAARMEKALAYLDSIAISVLNVSGEPNLDGANRGLAGLVSRIPPVGENYRLVKLGGTPPVYAIAVNLGLGGPAAVRIYAGSAGSYALAAKIDRFVQKDFLDSDVELAPVSNSEAVFVTISGRTDDLSTGLFSAWKFDERGVINLWNSDLLQQSSYQAGEKGFELAYCSQVDDDQPSLCHKMSRDLYRYQGEEWKRVETIDLPAPKADVK
jgi:hypothetical protein